MHTHYPYRVSTVERVIYDIAKNYYQLEKDDIEVSVLTALHLGDYTFKNHLGFPVHLTYRNDVFSLRDESLMLTRGFNLLREYAIMGVEPTLTHFRKLRHELYVVHEKTLPKHRRVTPSGIEELIADIGEYFDVEVTDIRVRLPELLTQHSLFIQDPILQKNYGLTMEVDTLAYPSLSVTRTHLRPRRRFSHYVLNRELINAITKLVSP